MRSEKQIDKLRADMARISWWHSITLGDWAVTPGREPYPRSRDQYLKIPEDLTGRTVLDIGAWDGLYSFDAERRGAKEVLAVDLWPQGDDGFLFARQALNSKVQQQEADVENLSAYLRPSFRPDVVFCFGVIYHLKNGPMLALREILDVMAPGGLLIVETAIMHGTVWQSLDHTLPMMEFTEFGRAGDPTNWWYPNRSCMEAMLRATGFNRVQYTGGIPGRGTWHARKK